MLCGVSSSHELDKDNVLITDKKLLDYAKHLNPDFRSTTRVCTKCYRDLRKSFVGKLRRFRQRRALAGNTLSTTTEKSSSSSQRTQTSKSDESLMPVLSSDSLRANSISVSSDSQPTPRPRPATAAKRKRDESLQRSNNSSLDDRPTTSKAAAAAQRARALRNATTREDSSLDELSTTNESATAPPHVVANTTTDDETRGINVLLGRRLPDIQPAPRRRRVMLEPVAMDMYLQGLTGG